MLLEGIHKRLIRSFLDFVILQELAKHQLGCYDIISIVRDRHNLVLSSGTVYNYLYHLESDGLVKGELNSAKKIFTLTERGNEVVSEFLGAKTKILGLLLNVFVNQ